MRISPVSFGSLLVFTPKDGKHENAKTLIETAFKNSESEILSYYDLEVRMDNGGKYGTGGYYNGADGNSTRVLAQNLDIKYKKELPKGSKKAILTMADFYFRPGKIERKYFITAPTAEEEANIHKILSESEHFYTAKFNKRG